MSLFRNAQVAGAAVLFVASSAAAASGWSASFRSEALATYVDSGRVLVIAAGVRADSQPAAVELAAALRATGKVGLVMTDEGLGDVSGLDDAAIVKKAAGLPVDVHAVVRVFPGDGGNVAAVVTLYSKTGEVRGAFSAKRGEPLAPKAESAAAGLTERTQSVVSRVLGGEKKQRSAAEEEFDKKSIYVRGGALVNAYGVAVRQWAVYHLGKEGRMLEPLEIFELAQRPDLVKSYHSRRRLKWIIGGIGLGMLIGSSILPVVVGGNDGWKWYVASTGATVGLVVALGGAVMSPSPISHGEMRGLVEEYNRKLRTELGLAAAPPAAPAGTYGLHPFLLPGGGGLAFQQSF
jgi:hypothetical protein